MFNRRWPPLYSTLLLTALVLCGVTLLCSLGFWQLSRGQQKAALMQKAEQAAHLQAFDTKSLLTEHEQKDDLRYYPVKLKGSFANEFIFLLDNKINNGRVGFHVLVPFSLDANNVLLVNRGWIPLEKSRKHLPTIEPVIGEVTIEGYLDFAYRNPFILNALESEHVRWPLIIQTLDMGWVQKTLGKNLYPMLVVLNKTSPFAYESEEKTQTWLSPERHYGYAFQWFALSATLLVLFVIYLIKRRFHS